jgi:hypothetical protein
MRIRNELLVAPIDVIPMLFMADGTEYDLPAVHIPVGGVATVNVNRALAGGSGTLADHKSVFGSAGLRYQYTSPGHVVGSIEMLNTTQSLIFIAPFDGIADANAEMSANEQNVLEGVWWRRDGDVDGYVSLSNATGSPEAATIEAFRRDGKLLSRATISLPAHATNVRTLSSLVDSPSNDRDWTGGIRVTYPGPMGSVLVTGGLVNDREGYSAGIPFVMATDSSGGQIPVTLASAGIMIGSQDPAMGFPKMTRFFPYAVLRNTTETALEYSLSLTWMSDSGSASTESLPSKMLEPLESQQVDMGAALAHAGLAAFNGSINLAVSFTGRPSDVVLASGSVDQTGTFVFEVEPQGVGKTNSKQVPYWSLDSRGTNTMYTVWNPTTEDQELVMTFYMGNGSGSYRLPLHLRSNSSRTIDIAELVRSQERDATGHTFPSNVTNGSAVIESVSGRRTPVTIVASGGTFNVRTATCGPNCINCCGYTFDVNPAEFSIPVGDTMGCAVTGTDCNGDQSNFAASWSSSDTSIMTVDGSGNVTGVDGGSATITGQLTDPVDVYTGQVCNTNCPTAEPGPTTSGTAQVPTSLAIVGTPAYTQGPPAPYVYNVNRQILDQQSPPQAINAVMHVHEVYSPNPPSGNCVSSTVSTSDGDSNDAGIFGPDLYSLPGSAPNPCSSSSTQSFVVTLAGHNYNIQTTYAVTWQFSGVSVVVR